MIQKVRKMFPPNSWLIKGYRLGEMESEVALKLVITQQAQGILHLISRKDNQSPKLLEIILKLANNYFEVIII